MGCAVCGGVLGRWERMGAHPGCCCQLLLHLQPVVFSGLLHLLQMGCSKDPGEHCLPFMLCNSAYCQDTRSPCRLRCCV